MAAGGVARALRGGLGTLAAVALGLGVALLLAEGLVRLFFDEPVQPRFVIDSGYGVRANKPGVDTRHYVPGDYDVRITTNSAGMRGQREYALERPPGTRRVLLLGDSFIFGYGVEDNQVLSVQLEDLLNAGGGPRWGVLNLSVSGFGQAEELVTWEEAGRAWQPDVVVWFYFENDIGNNAVAQLYELTGDGGVRRTGKSFLPGTNLQDAMLSVPPVRWLFENSEAWNLVRNRLSSLVQKSLIREQGLADYGDTSEAGIGLTRALSHAAAAAPPARAPGPR